MTIYHQHHIIPRHMGGTDDPSNLIKLTVEEHAEAHKLLYEKHGRWQDYAAWQGLLGLAPKAELLSIISKQRNQEKLDSGTHLFQNSEFQRNLQRRRIENGTHHFLGSSVNQKRIDEGTHHLLDKDKARERVLKQISDGKHPFLTEENKQRVRDLLDTGNHPFTKIHICPHCGKEGKGTSMFRWHFDNCKHYHSVPAV